MSHYFEPQPRRIRPIASRPQRAAVVRRRMALASVVYAPIWLGQLMALFAMVHDYATGTGTEFWLVGILFFALVELALALYVVRRTLHFAATRAERIDFAGDVFLNVLFTVGVGVCSLFWLVAPYTAFS